MTARRRRRLLLGAMIVLAGGCGAPPKARTTFLRDVDLVDMTDRMVQSFGSDPALGARGENAAPWVVSVDHVANFTNEIIPEREKWLYVGRLRAVLASSTLTRSHRIIWVIPPERWPLVAAELGYAGDPVELRAEPTHLLTAEFHAITGTSERGRTDAYVCDFQLVDLVSGALVWEDAWEVKRSISGLTYD